MHRIPSAAIVCAALTFAGAAHAQQRDFSTVEMKTTNLGHNTYLLEGRGGNITIAVGADSIIMVDGEFAPLHDKIKAAIGAVSKQPIKYLVNTHFHGDHTGGNAPFSKDGAEVVANANVGKRLAAETVNGLTGAKTPPVEPAAIPGRLLTRSTILKVKDRRARLMHVPNAHTDGDTFVWFKDANVLATGDIFINGRYPNIDFANGGNIKGMIAGVDEFLRLAKDDTKIVPGHGPLATRADLLGYRAMLVTARDRIARLIADGKSESDVLAAKPLADLDGKWAADAQAATNFMRVVYNSLKPAPAS